MKYFDAAEKINAGADAPEPEYQLPSASGSFWFLPTANLISGINIAFQTRSSELSNLLKTI